MTDCPFCERESPVPLLWESAHYRVVADGFPRCPGHVLLIPREHLPSHMHAPAAWMPELLRLQNMVREFLGWLGGATFFENGAVRQQVPHAHLHGLPFAAEVPDAWVRDGAVEPISGWEAARGRLAAEGGYAYLETGRVCCLVHRYGKVRRGLRRQMVARTAARFEPGSEKLVRGGADWVSRTGELWRAWTAGAGPATAGDEREKDA